jgi:hypothetical protein
VGRRGQDAGAREPRPVSTYYCPSGLHTASRPATVGWGVEAGALFERRTCARIMARRTCKHSCRPALAWRYESTQARARFPPPPPWGDMHAGRSARLRFSSHLQTSRPVARACATVSTHGVPTCVCARRACNGYPSGVRVRCRVRCRGLMQSFLSGPKACSQTHLACYSAAGRPAVWSFVQVDHKSPSYSKIAKLYTAAGGYLLYKMVCLPLSLPPAGRSIQT